MRCRNSGSEARGRCGLRRSLIVLVLAALPVAGAYAAPKTDVVALVNGDHVTGEVKELAQGKLTFKTDNAGTLYIEWDKIVSLESRQRLQLELSSGVRRFGSVAPTTIPGELLLSDSKSGASVTLPLKDIVHIYPIDEGDRLARFDGYLTAGYNYTKANNLQEFVFTGGLSTTQEKRKWSLDASTAVATQDGTNDTQRFDILGNQRRFLPARWFWQATLQFESNEELGLDLRTSVGGAFGRYLVQTHDQEWAWYAGFNLTQEQDVAQQNEQNVEAAFGTQYALFRYDTPERTVYVDLRVLPSLTDSGRVRAAATARCRYEIVKDFFFELSVYGTYDNRPGADAKSHSDYGTETSLGFTF
jgi:hypothetical protein